MTNEKAKFICRKFKIRYRQQNSDGTFAAGIASTDWDAAENALRRHEDGRALGPRRTGEHVMAEHNCQRPDHEVRTADNGPIAGEIGTDSNQPRRMTAQTTTRRFKGFIKGKMFEVQSLPQDRPRHRQSGRSGAQGAPRQNASRATRSSRKT